jgi:integrase/recombinase XerC
METWMEIHKEFETPYVWISLENDNHLPLGTRSIQNIVRRIGKEADLPSLTPHTLRHTFAKNLADSSQGIEKISLLLGHADLNTTKRYILPNASDLEKTVTAIETDLDHIL